MPAITSCKLQEVLSIWFYILNLTIPSHFQNGKFPRDPKSLGTRRGVRALSQNPVCSGFCFSNTQSYTCFITILYFGSHNNFSQVLQTCCASVVSKLCEGSECQIPCPVLVSQWNDVKPCKGAQNIQIALPVHSKNKSQEIHSVGCFIICQIWVILSTIKFLTHFFYLNWEILHSVSVNAMEMAGTGQKHMMSWQIFATKRGK